jgi:hypothetical protein
MILLDSLSDLKELRLVNFHDLDDVYAPNPNSPKGKFPSIRGISNDDPGMSVSKGSELH